MPPNADQQQDVNLMYAIERDGGTMISYTRKRDTGDLNGDLAIEVSTFKTRLFLPGQRKHIKVVTESQ